MNTENMRQHFESDGSPARLDRGTAGECCAVATGSAIERHLIDDGWIMRADDEALDHDCNGWWRLDSHHSGKWMIGKPYNRNFFVPIRRAGKRPDPLAEILSPNAPDQPAVRIHNADTQTK